MDREQIEADIAWFEQELARVEDCYADPVNDASVMRRAIARLRADLARMDGPAEGTERRYLVVDHGTGFSSRDDAHRYASHRCSVVVSVDLPRPSVVEVEGTVEVVR